jgi:isoprenylcysteine carboxyl methyltransferase (ICMT) family protein YpbQ
MVLMLLVTDVVLLSAAFGARTLAQWRRTGDGGWRLGRPHSPAEAAARGLLIGAAALTAASLAVGGDRGGSPAGLAVMGAAGLLVLVAQAQMGASWRIGVDPAERTALVEGGVYRWVRNPIYTGLAGYVAGHALALPHPLALAAVAAAVVGVEVQVRAVEEPYLRALHGDRWTAWAGRAGRFVPIAAASRRR